MDPLKRGPEGLRRFFRAHARLRPQDEGRPGGGVREYALRSGETSVRKLYERTVATFVPPQLPIVSADATCSRAIVVLTHTTGPIGGLQLVADLMAHSNQTTVFILGFATNVDQYWVCMFGALNWERDVRGVLASGSSGVFFGYGASAWLGREFTRAREHGVTFRLFSTTNLAPERKTLLSHWMEKFDPPLGRPLGPHDLSERQAYPEGPQFGEEGGVAEEDDETLSFRVRLIYE